MKGLDRTILTLKSLGSHVELRLRELIYRSFGSYSEPSLREFKVSGNLYVACYGVENIRKRNFLRSVGQNLLEL